MHPYSDLPPSRFWRTGVAEENPFFINDIYEKKFALEPKEKIATAGSCFAQHISTHLKKNGYNVLDVEPAPNGLAAEKHQRYGFGVYSARYGNIYTMRQLKQLASEVENESGDSGQRVWSGPSGYVDALRPNVEPKGLSSAETVLLHRKEHLEKVKILFETMDVFVFTMGLTEAWEHKRSGIVYPTAPGTIAGSYEEDSYRFVNYSFEEIVSDFRDFCEVLNRIREQRPFKVILTVSPVPLAATAEERHVLQSTVYSKSVLRAAAGRLYDTFDFVDYFPSYEIVLNPKFNSVAFRENMRDVRPEIVNVVMNHFFSQHLPLHVNLANVTSELNGAEKMTEVVCEEALLEAFAK
ncbi:GSCFA domain-containing protein [Loktanella sp. M215]|uniref:GSCFA domain-containing protein n=1 Tax=Loktanella sp. M215 TaxID=2675431 RepID=UPI001F2ADAA7|nr:GSCFA domain-containing protein [Loktanella sp. M215]MCF7700937.1 GSCFA family protein [Loktanella sp. M215]